MGILELLAVFGQATILGLLIAISIFLFNIQGKDDSDL